MLLHHVRRALGAGVVGLSLLAPCSIAFAQAPAVVPQAELGARGDERAAGRGEVGPLLGVGDVDADLVFTPLPPCRLIDTRLAGGAFVAGEARNYDLIGPTDYSSTGGNAAGCNIPGTTTPVTSTTFGNTVRALVLNFAAVTPSGNGNLRAYPSNQSVPTAALLNFSPTVAAIANGNIVPTCDAAAASGDPCPSGDLSLKVFGAGTHLVVDVVGYFTAQRFTLASNRTLIGSYGVDLAAASVSDHGLSTFSFHPPLASAPNANIIEAGGAPTANCPGSSANPLAAPGQLCIYETLAMNVGSRCVASTGASYACGAADAHGAGVAVQAAGAGRLVSVGAWAVTAP
jgi:hypothetical protein